MNKNYGKGVRLEREVIEIFKKAGYQATRTAGSHSPYDVILWKEGMNNKICFVSFVQCKVTKDKSILKQMKGGKI
jgi:Holliday junction resolvase